MCDYPVTYLARIPSRVDISVHQVHLSKSLKSIRMANGFSIVCGEDCAIQVCPECAPADKKDQVVDLILSRTLSDVVPELGGYDDLVMTIPSCGHVFTVETLDGHTAIRDFYSRDKQDTKWTGLKTPNGPVKPPSCPTCRSPITCNRYGRIIKRADLDILERNVASYMSQSLDRCLGAVQRFDKNRSTALLVDAASTVDIPAPKKKPALKKLKNAQEDVLKKTEERPALYNDILARNNKLHCIDSAVNKVWTDAVRPLFDRYRDIQKLAETRSAHTQAWEAAFSFLYEREMETGLKDPSKMPRNPKEHAMRMATMQVGQPRPLADRRFLVEAFWVTIHIRLTMNKLARAWLEKVDQQKCHIFHLLQWADYIQYLLKTCSMDADKALAIAKNSNSYRQIIKSVLLGLRIDLETFRFNLDMCKKFGTFKDSDKREELREKAIGSRNACLRKVDIAIYEHLNRTGSSQAEAAWLENSFTTTAHVIVDEWSKLEQSIWRDTFYQPVSLDEKMDILRAFNFGKLVASGR